MIVCTPIIFLIAIFDALKLFAIFPAFGFLLRGSDTIIPPLDHCVLLKIVFLPVMRMIPERSKVEVSGLRAIGFYSYALKEKQTDISGVNPNRV